MGYFALYFVMIEMGNLVWYYFKLEEVGNLDTKYRGYLSLPKMEKVENSLDNKIDRMAIIDNNG